jgi:hypothetical protein
MAIKVNLTLLSNAAVSGNPTLVPTGGRYVYAVTGTFGGTSSKLQMLGPDGTTYVDVPTTTLTAAGMPTIELPAGCTVKTVLTGGTPSAMYATLGLVWTAD